MADVIADAASEFIQFPTPVLVEVEKQIGMAISMLFRMACIEIECDALAQQIPQTIFLPPPVEVVSIQDKVDQFSVYGNGLNAFRNFERQISLLNFNIIWKEQLEKANLLRDAVSWRSYGQKNPLTEYKIEAYASFQKRKESFIYYTLYQIFHVNII